MAFSVLLVCLFYYRPRSEGDNALGSVRPSVCPFVGLCVRGSALPSAAKSNKSHYQSKVFVCVSVIRRRIRIIARARSIGVLILCFSAPTDHGFSPLKVEPVVLASKLIFWASTHLPFIYCITDVFDNMELQSTA